jgi:hypothetical protein
MDQAHGSSDRQRYADATIVCAGALVGAAVAYLVLSPDGRRICNAIIDALDTFSSEWRRMVHATNRARLAAVDGWEALENDPTTSPTGRMQ